MEKWWVTHLQSFADLVFLEERIKVGLEKGKSDHPDFMNAKTGANEKDENEGETLAMIAIPTWSNFPSTQQCHYLAKNSPSHPIIHKSHPQISHKACLLTARPMPKHHL